MNRVVKCFMSCVFITYIVFNCNIFAYAGGVQPVENMNRDYYSYSVISGYIKQLDEMDFLTEDEKRLIRDEANLTKPYYSKINILENKVKKIDDKMMKKARPFKKKYDALYSSNIKLWKVLDEEFVTLTVGKKVSKVQLLEVSRKLTQEEKKLLQEDAKELDSLDLEITKIQQMADKATSKLNKLIAKEYRELEKIYEKTAFIWEVIFKNIKLK